LPAHGSFPVSGALLEADSLTDSGTVPKADSFPVIGTLLDADSLPTRDTV